jgi:hypothetical protein
MVIFGLTGRGDTNDTKPECEAATEAGEKSGVTQQECLVEASIAGAVVAGSTNQTEKDVAAVSTNTKPRRGARSELQRYTSRQNGKKGGGPTTAAGKAISSQNAITHGLLAKRLMQLNDENAKDFAYILGKLREDLQPAGILEETLVERMAYECVRMAAAARYCCDAALFVVNTSGSGPGNLMRYESMIASQFSQSMHELERLQRLRRGEDVPAPLNVQVSHEISDAATSGD